MAKKRVTGYNYFYNARFQRSFRAIGQRFRMDSAAPDENQKPLNQLNGARSSKGAEHVLWRAYEQRWKRFLGQEKGEVTFDSIPWPPRYEGLLQHVKGLTEESGAEGEALSDEKAWRKARE